MLLQKINNKAGGFTLIELMIVVAIIGIAVMVLVPLIGSILQSVDDSDTLDIVDQDSDPDEADPAESEPKPEESGGSKL